MDRTIAFDRNGGPLGIGSLVRIADGTGAAVGKVGFVRQVTYKSDGTCVIHMSGHQQGVDSECVEAARMGDFESEVFRILYDAGVRMRAKEVEPVVARLRAAFEADASGRDVVETATEGE